jgi:hypothetical protein
LKSKAVEQFSLFTLKDAAEQADDCAQIYNKSLHRHRFAIPIKHGL